MADSEIPAKGARLRGARKRSGLTLEQLADVTGISVSQLSRLESGSRGQRLEQMLPIAAALGVDVAEIIDIPLPKGALEFKPAPVAVPPRDAMPRDVPVWGSAAGSIIDDTFEGFHLFSGQPVDMVRRPPALYGVPDAYAVYVTGDSMYPMHPQGALRFVHPHRPPSPGDSVIIMTRHWESDPGQGYIKLLRRRRGDRIIIEQLNPPATIEVPLQYVVSVHKVLDMNDLFGV